MLNIQIGKLRLKTLQLLSLTDELGSLRAVAAAVHTSQPAVTQSIQELEQVFGVSLLIRQSTGVTLTAAGQVLVKRLRVVLQEMNTAQLSVQAPAMPVLRLGILPVFMMSDLIPAVLRQWPQGNTKGRLPFRLQLHESNVPGLRERLSADADDAVLTRLSADAFEPQDAKSMRVVPIHADGLVVFVRADHALLQNRRRPLQLAQLLDCDWVLPSARSQLRRSVDEQFVAAHQVPPIPMIETNSLYSLISTVGATDLLGIAPRSAVLKFGNMFKLRTLRIESFNDKAMEVVAIYHRRQEENQALQLFLTQLKRAGAATGARA